MKLSQTPSTESLDLWVGKPTPRYTSYPPAPYFHNAITAVDFKRSIAGLSPDDPVSLYLHIPFCRALCLYCGCNTSITQRHERVTNYLGALKRELKIVADKAAGKLRVSHLHFGGGTPNIVSDEEMLDLFAYLRNLYDFDACREIAMELDPRTVTQSQVKTLAACGVTRVSLGVQDFNAEVQQTVNRIQPLSMVKHVCEWLRGAGINHINFDIMYGLPRQTPASVAETAQQVCALLPDRVALFSYAHVPQIKKHQQTLELIGLPDDHERLAMDQAARKVLTKAGYIEIGMDHFARPDDPMTAAYKDKKLRRNFQGYTDDTAQTLLSFGASSISQTPDGFFQNERDEKTYQEILAKGHLATNRGIIITRDDRLRGAIIEQLMCYLTCDVENIFRAYGRDAYAFKAELAALKPYEDAGLIKRKGTTITLTSPHRMAIRVICQAFDRYASQPPIASSRAA